jgi:hypothetical protein
MFQGGKEVRAAMFASWCTVPTAGRSPARSRPIFGRLLAGSAWEVETLEERYGHHHPDFQEEAAGAFGGQRLVSS